MSHAVTAPVVPSAGPRRAVGLLLLALAAALLVVQPTFRVVEAEVTAWVVGQFTDGRSNAAVDVIYFGIGTQDVHGIQITPMCSTVVLLVPLLALGGVLMLLGSVPFRRAAVALLGALAIAVACNVIRYVGSSVALQRWGTAGFDVVHEYVGSLFVIFGFAGAVLLQVVVSVRGRRRGTAPDRTRGPGARRADGRARRADGGPRRAGTEHAAGTSAGVGAGAGAGAGVGAGAGIGVRRAGRRRA